MCALASTHRHARAPALRSPKRSHHAGLVGARSRFESEGNNKTKSKTEVEIRRFSVFAPYLLLWRPKSDAIAQTEKPTNSPLSR